MQVKLPAVSGSSGRLIVERPKTEADQKSWPGQVFANPELSYEEAMQAYVEATRDRKDRTRGEKGVKGGRKSEKQALWRANQAVREERYQVRERRKQEDAAWRALRKQLISEREAFRTLPKAERRKQRQVREALQESWQAAWEQHRASLAIRAKENAQR